MAPLVLTAWLLVAGCTSSPAPATDGGTADADVPAADGSVADAGPGPCSTPEDCDGDGAPRAVDCDDRNPDVHPGAAERLGNGVDDDCDGSTPDAERIELDATLASVWLASPVDLVGAGTGRVGAIEVRASSGTVEMDGTPMPAFVDESIPWPDIRYDIHQLLVVGADRIFVVWLYCDAGALAWIYLEGTEGTTLTFEEARGTCAGLAESAVADVAFPAVSIPLPTAVAGFAVDGPRIRIDAAGTPGRLRSGDRETTLLPFGVVDCSTDCGSPGWYELHCLQWSSTERLAAFTIVYLYMDPALGRGRDVGIVTSRALPGLGMPFPGYDFLEASFGAP